MRIFYIYTLTCQTNGKQYVGKTHDPRGRLKDHFRCRPRHAKSALGAALRKHGVTNFVFEIVACAKDEQSAFTAERELISRLQTKTPNGYNLTEGGEGSTGIAWTLERRAKNSLINKGRVFGPRPLRVKLAISAAQRGRSHSKEHRDKIKASLKARHATPEMRAKMIEVQQARWRKKKFVNPFYELQFANIGC